MFIHHEEHGHGDPILCIHGTGSSALVWSDAVRVLARTGRVIAYDRRGCTRSERPEPYERTNVAEHAEDAATLLRELDAAPAIVIGRSYGGTVALELARRYPDLVRALVVLEGDATRELAPATARWLDAVAERLRAVPDEAVAQTLMDEVLGEGTWPQLPDGLREIVSANAPAIRAELNGEWWLSGDPAQITAPTLLVAATDSRPELREPTEALARVLPDARLTVVPGGHLIDPAGPEVLAFVRACCRA